MSMMGKTWARLGGPYRASTQRSCVRCTSDGECDVRGQDLVCDAETALCVHKPLLPLAATDLTGTLGVVLGAALAAGAGLGGGGLFVPLFVLVMGFAPSEAIPLSKATIFGSALANFVVAARRRHPAASRPLIDYAVVLMLEPMTLAGSILGVLLNTVLPSWLILGLLIVLLTATTLRTYAKAKAIAARETAVSKRDSVLSDEANASGASEVAGLSPELAAIRAAEARIPMGKVASVGAVWLAVLVLSMIKGGHGARSVVGIEPCSAGYWLVLAAALPGAWLVTVWIGGCLRREHAAKEAAGYTFLPSDIRWTAHTTKVIPRYSFGAGVAAGLMGIGGGMIKGPLLLELGMEPSASTATSGFMIMFTSSATVAQFVVLGQLALPYAAWFAGWGFVAALCGQYLLRAAVARTGTQSLIAFLVAGVIGLSTALLTYTGAVSVVKELASGASMGFSTPC
ncbi:uncharacterized protein AMSG_02333 [Thecamonas trahens ATCC 50062]|uniref:Uncharacterized protein n=1 Tax=Thecamonas trahens ATCC 50062 TaxID=461836 RepID=A0A0L0DXV7_THETB|nr:hypothetical protein AMSG_02333 [Thecamonas trahens ATCC 50062]KNC56363.1 hypothetical protein AMSG_02333 [Thecamonas trahens ATCC 50062]|eukprot:XP_013760878.1 hypothetical protein AMSG_02333 [Thecamonas trahens ATCC 50062]